MFLVSKEIKKEPVATFQRKNKRKKKARKKIGATVQKLSMNMHKNIYAKKLYYFLCWQSVKKLSQKIILKEHSNF